MPFSVVQSSAEHCNFQSSRNISKIRQYIKFVTATVSKTGTTSSAGKDPQTAVNEALANIDDNQPIVVDIPDIDDSQW